MLKTRKIYLASSWRNPLQPIILDILRTEGHEVYDFRNPSKNDTGFHWSDVGVKSGNDSFHTFKTGLEHPIAKAGFSNDWDAMNWADTGVLLLPCGKSAHLELGYFVGAKKPCAILTLTSSIEPELMYKMTDLITNDTYTLLDWLNNNGY